jgi:serine/threonine protein kinase
MNWIDRLLRRGPAPPATVLRSGGDAAPRKAESESRIGDFPLPDATRLGRYRITGVLGRGGFGYTYRAVDEQLGGEFAIKEYLPRGSALRQPGLGVGPVSAAEAAAFSAGRAHFLAEARVLRQLSIPTAHPNVVAVRDYLEAFGTGFMVMDFCDGESLAAKLGADRTLAQGALCRLLGPLLDGLAHVHARSLVHRDVKPDNVCLRADGTPVLIDFGAARRAVSSQSQVATMVFTPGYAPIEQYLGSAQIGPWTDIYSLGATMYRAVTGRTPMESIARLHADDQPPAALLGHGRYVPRLLEAIDAALAVRVADRPRSVEQWRSTMAGLLEPGGDADIDPGDFLTVGQFLDQQTALHHAGRNEQALASVLRARRLHGERATFWNNQGIALSDLGRHREALDCFERGLEMDSDYQHLWCNKGRALRAMGRHQEALVCYDRAIPLDPSHPTPWDCKGNCLLDLGRRAEAKQCFERVVQLDPTDSNARQKMRECGDVS